MKKLSAILLALLLLFSVAACSQPAPEAPAQQAPAEQAPAEQAPASDLTYEIPTVNLRLGCTNATGTYTVVGTAISQVMNEFCPSVQITPEVTDGAVSNMQMLATNDLDLGMSSSFVCSEAATGGSKNFAEPNEMYVLCSFNASAVHFVAREGSGIQSIQDLVGKRVSTCEPGSSHEKYGLNLLASNGIDPEQDLDNWARISISDSCDAIADNRLDAVFYMGGAPVTKVLELVENGDGYFVELDQTSVDGFIAEYPFAYESVIPAGVYGDEELSCIVGTNLIVASKDLPEDVAYWVVKTLFDHFDSWNTCHASVKNYFMSLENAILGAPIDFHPGAIKYFQEIGLM